MSAHKFCVRSRQERSFYWGVDLDEQVDPTLNVLQRTKFRITRLLEDGEKTVKEPLELVEEDRVRVEVVRETVPSFQGVRMAKTMGPKSTTRVHLLAPTKKLLWLSKEGRRSGNLKTR